MMGYSRKTSKLFTLKKVDKKKNDIIEFYTQNQPMKNYNLIENKIKIPIEKLLNHSKLCFLKM